MNIGHFQYAFITHYQISYGVAMPNQYELRRLFYLMNIQTHRNSTPNTLILGAFFNS